MPVSQLDYFHMPQRSLSNSQSFWLKAVCAGLSHKKYVLRTDDSSCLHLALVSSHLFGRFLVSLPYVNSGGVDHLDSISAQALISQACDLADQLDVQYLELRHEHPVAHPRLNHERTDKAHMRLSLPPCEIELDASFKSKLRSQIRKSSTHGHQLAIGSDELLNDFYQIFSVNMRDLGTPVFGKKLFSSILSTFGDQAEIAVVKNNDTPVAAALLVHNNGKTEVPSASCLRKWNHTGANMWMYRQLLGRAIERGSHTFDFGRSSKDSGTYKFKAQWGAQPHPATWQYYVRKGSVEDMRPDSAKNKRRIEAWKKLPVWLTKIMGPPIVRGIP